MDLTEHFRYEKGDQAVESGQPLEPLSEESVQTDPDSVPVVIPLGHQVGGLHDPRFQPYSSVFPAQHRGRGPKAG